MNPKIANEYKHSSVMTYKNTEETYLRNASFEDLKSYFDIDNCSIFSERDKQKEQVNKIVPLTLKSTIDGDDYIIPSTLYEPKNASENIMLYFHGGGWVRGSIESHDCLCRKIANALNIRVISVEYRLSPQYKFPTALNDALSAYYELFENNKIDFDKIILSGDSSGGNLCTAMCIKLKEIKIASSPMAQILFYPVLSNDFNSDSYIKFGHELNLTKAMMQWFVYQYTGRLPEDADMLNNKLLYPLLENDMSVFPKTLIISAEMDVLFDGQSLFESKLENANVKTRRIILKEAKHGFMTYGKDHKKYADLALEQIKKVWNEFI